LKGSRLRQPAFVRQPPDYGGVERLLRRFSPAAAGELSRLTARDVLKGFEI